MRPQHQNARGANNLRLLLLEAETAHARREDRVQGIGAGNRSKLSIMGAEDAHKRDRTKRGLQPRHAW